MSEERPCTVGGEKHKAYTYTAQTTFGSYRSTCNDCHQVVYGTLGGSWRTWTTLIQEEPW